MADTLERPSPKNSTSLDPIKEAFLAAAGRTMDDARASPAAAYTDLAFWEWEAEHIFKQEWNCLAHVSQIPMPGDYINVELLGEPLIVVRGKDNGVSVLSRVCQHRAMDIMPADYGYAERGNARLFMCPYHSWTYELDGKLKAAPEMQKTQNFCRGDYGLKTFRSEVWEGYVFVTFNDDAESVTSQLTDLQKDVAGWSMGEMVVATEVNWTCKFNWKVLIENWMEPYHHMGIHIKTLQPMLPAKGCWTEPFHPHYTRAHLPLRQSLVEAAEKTLAAGGKPDGLLPIAGVPDEFKNEWTVHVGFPTYMMLTAPSLVLWYRLLPIGLELCHLTTAILVTREAMEEPDYAEGLAKQKQVLVDFHLEDMQVCEAVQRGLHSRAFTQGQLSYLEEPLLCIQKYIAGRIEAERVS